MILFYLVCLAMLIQTNCFCPTGCGCDDEKLETICFNTELGVMPITLNPNIRTLILKHNQFKTVDASISFYPSLRYLDLSKNKLKKLPDKVFMAQHDLEDLNLSDNNISELSEKALSGLGALKTIKVNNNKIRIILANSFSDLLNLEVLDLSDNYISKIDQHAFSNLRWLKALDLENNALDTVPTESLNSLQTLLELDLSGNNIAVISSHALQSLSMLVILNLARNNLREINEAGFSGLTSVKELYLENNNIDKVPTGALSRMINLEKIHLGKNPYEEISENALIGNVNLNMVNISHCPKLNEIKASAFKRNILLKSIVISDNPNLKTIDSDAFNRNTQVESLDFRRNSFNSLSENLLNLHSLNDLHLSGNLWHCDCEMKWLQQVIFSIINNTQGSVRIIRCFSPNSLWDSDLATVNIPECREASTSEQYQPMIDESSNELDEACIVFIVTVVFATLVITVVIVSAVICIFIQCKKRAQDNASCNASDTSRGTDVSYYQVGIHVNKSTVIKPFHDGPSQQFLKPYDESDVLWEDDSNEQTLIKKNCLRYPL